MLYVCQLLQIINIIFQTKKLQMPSYHRYSKISLQKRQKLVHMVLQQKKTIAQAARKLIIKPSTAKLIIKKFRETGTYVDKKMPNYARKESKQPEPTLEPNIEPEVGNQIKDQIIQPGRIQSSKGVEVRWDLEYYPFQLVFAPMNAVFYY